MYAINGWPKELGIYNEGSYKEIGASISTANPDCIIEDM